MSHFLNTLSNWACWANTAFVRSHSKLWWPFSMFQLDLASWSRGWVPPSTVLLELEACTSSCPSPRLTSGWLNQRTTSPQAWCWQGFHWQLLTGAQATIQPLRVVDSGSYDSGHIFLLHKYNKIWVNLRKVVWQMPPIFYHSAYWKLVSLLQRHLLVGVHCSDYDSADPTVAT